MAANENLVNRIRKALENTQKVKEKTMFRGLTFMVDDKMCISVSDHHIMCRIDPSIHNEVIASNSGCQTMKMKGRELKGYVLVEEDAITNKKELDYWIGLSLDFNERAKSSKKNNE